MIARLPENLLGVRDRALLLIGFCGAFRRSELVALDAADVAITRDGLVVTIRRSKTDQEGEGRKIGIPYASHVETCPVRSFQEWLEKSGITQGPLFAIDASAEWRLSVYPRRCCPARKEICLRRGLDPRSSPVTAFAVALRRVRRWEGRLSGRS